MPGASDIAEFTGLLGFQHRLQGSARGKDFIRIIHADNLVKLKQVHVVSLEALEAFLDLGRSARFAAAVDFGHQKHLVPIAVPQGLPHPHFAFSLMVVPTVIHERDAAVDGTADDFEAFALLHGVADVEPSQADGRNFLPRAAQSAVDHSCCGFFLSPGCRPHDTDGKATHGRTVNKLTSCYGRQFCGWRPLGSYRSNHRFHLAPYSGQHTFCSVNWLSITDRNVGGGAPLSLTLREGTCADEFFCLKKG